MGFKKNAHIACNQFNNAEIYFLFIFLVLFSRYVAVNYFYIFYLYF